MSQFKRAQVVMLPTDDITSFYKWGSNLYHNCLKKSHVNTQSDSQHLYILSDDEIKKGDWVLLPNKEVLQIPNNKEVKFIPINNFIRGYSLSDCRKIISTTDTSVIYRKGFAHNLIDGFADVPQPSTQFIEKYIEEYNKGYVIKDVLVEYENTFKSVKNYYKDKKDLLYDKLKINPKDNTITIKKLKDSWNREEVVQLLTKRDKHLEESHFPNQLRIDTWIKENL